MNQEIRVERPLAWCDALAIVFGVLMLLVTWFEGGFRTHELWMENWWPLLRIELVVWGVLRLIDLVTGGPWRRG